MTHDQFIEDVGMIAKDIWAAKVFSIRAGRATRYREPREALPFGFGWYIEEKSISVEVHPVVDTSTEGELRVVALQIYGVRPADGRLTLIVTEPI